MQWPPKVSKAFLLFNSADPEYYFPGAYLFTHIAILAILTSYNLTQIRSWMYFKVCLAQWLDTEFEKMSSIQRWPRPVEHQQCRYGYRLSSWPWWRFSTRQWWPISAFWSDRGGSCFIRWCWQQLNADCFEVSKAYCDKRFTTVTCRCLCQYKCLAWTWYRWVRQWKTHSWYHSLNRIYWWSKHNANSENTWLSDTRKTMLQDCWWQYRHNSESECARSDDIQGWWSCSMHDLR